MFKNLHELIATMPDEKACRDYLIKERWNGVITCPYCGNEGAYVIEGGKRFKCRSSACYRKFSVTVGTIFEASNFCKLTQYLFQWIKEYVTKNEIVNAKGQLFLVPEFAYSDSHFQYAFPQ